MNHVTQTLVSMMILGFLASACAPRQHPQTLASTLTTEPSPRATAVPSAAASQAPQVAVSPTTLSSQTGIGYSSVDEALKDLTSKPGAHVQVENGWTIITENNGLTMWSFAPSNDPAYPAVVKREIYQQSGGWYVNMNVLCGGPASACNKLVADFRALNAQMGLSAAATQPAP